MTYIIILAIIIVITLLILSLPRGCGCKCRSCRAGNCLCDADGCDSAQVHMEFAPLTLPEPEPVGAKIILGVDAQPQHVESHSHVGAWIQSPPDVLLFTEPIYSQNGEGTETDDAPEQLAAEHFTSQLNNTRKVYLHYTDWCGYCKKMKPVWAQVKETLAETAIEFYEIDEDIAKTPGVNGYPTILMIDENGHRQQYPGAIEFESLRAWCVSPAVKATNS